MKLGLGTVQFGLKYGINNTVGKTDLKEVEKILHRAKSSNLSLLDTAADYGDSEDNIGKLIGKDPYFSIITKISKGSSPTESLKNSLERLKRTHVYGLLFHDFQQYESDPATWEEMMSLKAQGAVTKIGFSLYLPEQLELLKNQHVSFDIIQIPYSILDQRFERYFKELKNEGVEIHVRSVFIQGLVFQKAKDLHPFFTPIKDKIQKLNKLSETSGKSIQSLCLNFAYSNAEIDKIIIGVDSDENLQRNLEVIDEGINGNEMEILRTLREHDEEMILPYKWKL
jgi:aryl-alcohol dehydrogenase-like predicted oxidoreductase